MNHFGKGLCVARWEKSQGSSCDTRNGYMFSKYLNIDSLHDDAQHVVKSYFFSSFKALLIVQLSWSFVDCNSAFWAECLPTCTTASKQRHLRSRNSPIQSQLMCIANPFTSCLSLKAHLRAPTKYLIWCQLRWRKWNGKQLLIAQNSCFFIVVDWLEGRRDLCGFSIA